MALLDVRNLSIGYQTRKGFLRAVDSVSFSVEEGKSLGFVGESGCGKTTIGMTLMGLLPKNASVMADQIMYKGRDLLKISPEEMRKTRWKDIAMIFQAAMNALNPVQRVGDQIVEAILIHEPALDKPAAQERVEALFDLVHIPRERIRDFPHQYSGGMKQRAIIAMALSCRPSLIIADEPTTALDVIVQDQILDEIKTLQKELILSILFISHDIAVVADVCHTIAVMYAGQIVEYGKREEVFETPVHPYTKALLGSYLTLDTEKTQLEGLNGETPNLIHPPKGCRFCDRCEATGPACRMEIPDWIDVSRTHKALCCKIT